MKKATVTITVDEEKLTALRLYLGQKDQQVETELERAIDGLYQKTVPAGVREFIDLRSGIAMPLGRTQRRKAAGQEVREDDEQEY